MEIKLDVQMTSNTMFDFMLYHAYRRSNGFMGPVIGTIALIFGLRYMAEGNTQFVVWLMFAALFFLMTPVSLLTKAKTQALQPMFKKPIHYVFDESGIKVVQDGNSAEFEWSAILRAVSTKKSIFLYTAKTAAFILPKEAFGVEYENALKLIAAHVEPKKVNIK